MPEGRAVRAGRGRGTARGVALACLERVERGAPAALALERALAEAELAGRDRALVTELVYGTVRMRLTLTYALTRYLRRAPQRLPRGVRLALELGLYQIFFLQRVPAHAAVSETVALVREVGQEHLTGLVNAVLRRAVREGIPPWPDDPVEGRSVRFSHPAWLVARWLTQYGTADAEALLAYDNTPPPLTVRVARETTRDAALAAFRAAGLTAEATSYASRGVRLHGAGEPTALPLFADGQLTVQDEASMLATDLLGARPGETVVDACAGLGTKTWALAEAVAAVGAAGQVWAVDVRGARIARLYEEGRRRGIPVAAPQVEARAGVGERPVVIAQVGDARELPDLLGTRDVRPARVLLDAPCTGLGVLRRRPELRWRRTPEDAERLHPLQVALLKAAVAAVEPGGEVLYVTCTTEVQENEGVVADALRDLGDRAERRVMTERVPPALRDGLSADGSMLRLFGPRTETDSFFYALIGRRR